MPELQIRAVTDAFPRAIELNDVRQITRGNAGAVVFTLDNGSTVEAGEPTWQELMQRIAGAPRPRHPGL